MKAPFVLGLLFSAFAPAFAADPAKPAAEPKKEKPLTPGGVYHAGDMSRPRPTVITPPTASTPEKAGTPPGDATVLFDGKDFAHWEREPNKEDPTSKEPKWKIENGCMEVTPKSGTLRCKDKFGSAQLHLEWAAPAEVVGKSQGRGNSGVLLSPWGEVQVLDSFENDTYPDGQAAAIYSKYPPLVNASRKPGEWQVYDIILQCAEMKNGKAGKPAMMTVMHNGVVVHHAVAFEHQGQEWTFSLQDHHNPVRYRNVWVRPLHRYDENAGK